MAKMPNQQEAHLMREKEKNRKEAFTANAVLRYGKELGEAFTGYTYGDSNDISSFSAVVIKQIKGPDEKQAQRAIAALLEASELRVKKLISKLSKPQIY